MQLTPLQLRTIRYYLQHRDHPPTWGSFLRAFSRTLVVWFTVGVAGVYFFVAIDRPMFAYLIVGMLVGAVLRETRRHQHIRQAWPAIAAIVDWERAEALAATPDAEPRDAADSPLR